MVDENDIIPDNLEVTDEAAKEATAPPKLRLCSKNEYIKFRVTSASGRKSAKGHRQISLTAAPLDVTGSPVWPKAFVSLIIPLPNENGQVPKTGGLCQQYLTATEPDTFPRAPSRDKETKEWMSPDTGETFTSKQQADEWNIKRYKAMVNGLKERYNAKKFDDFVGREFYARSTVTQGTNQNGEPTEFDNLANICATPPDDALVIDSDFIRR